MRSILLLLMGLCLTSVANPLQAQTARPKRTEFRTALIEAAEQAREEGKLSTRDVMRIRIATLNKRVCDRLQNKCCEEAVKAKVMAPAAAENPQAFDWSGILSFLKELLPMIMDFLKIFGLFADNQAPEVILCGGCVGVQCQPTVVTPSDADECPPPALTAAEGAALWVPMGPLSAEQVRRAYEAPTVSVLVRRPLFSPGAGCWWDRGPLRRLVSSPWRGAPAARR